MECRLHMRKLLRPAIFAEYKGDDEEMFHILVVDDDKNTRRLMRAVLEAENYAVTTAENGEDALKAMEREHIDLVVLDVMMPKMDGYEFTKTLRSVQNELPILMVSAKQLPSDKKKGFLAGTDDFMTKPVDEEEKSWQQCEMTRRTGILRLAEGLREKEQGLDAQWKELYTWFAGDEKSRSVVEKLLRAGFYKKEAGMLFDFFGQYFFGFCKLLCVFECDEAGKVCFLCLCSFPELWFTAF